MVTKGIWVSFAFCAFSPFLIFPLFMVGVFLHLSLLSRAPPTTWPPRTTLNEKEAQASKAEEDRI